MMKRLLESGLVRDAGVFAGAVLGIYTIRSLHRVSVDECFENYPRVAQSPMARMIAPLAKMQQPAAFAQVMASTDHFISLIQDTDNKASGFLANRLASEIPAMIRELVLCAQRSRNSQVAIKAFDYERDELTTVTGVCDDMVRNMLLDRKPYA